MLSERQTESDDSLMQRVLQRDRQAFDVLVSRWKQPLMGYFYRQFARPELCEDLVQEVLCKVWFARHYQAQGQFKAWLFRLAHHIRIDWLRRHRSELGQPALALDALAEWPDATQVGPEESLLQQEQQQAIQTALGTLSAAQRELLVLSRYQELSHAEIARITGASANTVKVQVFRALKQLAKKFQEVTHVGITLLLAVTGAV